MSDMYGALRSNEFKVKNVEAFTAWFDNFVFGDEIEFWVDTKNEDGSGEVSFGGHEQYPTAYPRFKKIVGSIEDYENPNDVDYDLEEIPDLNVWAEELKTHLAEGEVFQVVAGGNEKLSYVGYSELLVAQDLPKPVWTRNYSDENKDVLKRRMVAAGYHTQPFA